MTELNRYVKDLCLKEGKKSQVARSNVQEILSIVGKEMAQDLYEAGYRFGQPFPGYEFRIVKALKPSIDKELKRLEKVENKSKK